MSIRTRDDDEVILEIGFKSGGGASYRYAQGDAMASYPDWCIRVASMETHGQSPTGFVKDAAELASKSAIMRIQRVLS